MNSIYSAFNNQNGMGNVVQHFRQFKNSMGNIDPRQEVMRYLQSGQISQSQLNQFQNMANQLTNILK